MPVFSGQDAPHSRRYPLIRKAYPICFERLRAPITATPIRGYRVLFGSKTGALDRLIRDDLTAGLQRRG